MQGAVAGAIGSTDTRDNVFLFQVYNPMEKTAGEQITVALSEHRSQVLGGEVLHPLTFHLTWSGGRGDLLFHLESGVETGCRCEERMNHTGWEQQ